VTLGVSGHDLSVRVGAGELSAAESRAKVHVSYGDGRGSMASGRSLDRMLPI